MANHMETNIQVKNGDIKVIEKLKEIFKIGRAHV